MSVIHPRWCEKRHIHTYSYCNIVTGYTFSGRDRNGKAFDFSAIIVIDRERVDMPEYAMDDDKAIKKVQAMAIISEASC